MTEEQRYQLTEGAATWGLALDETAVARFEIFAERLEETNRQFNLTRIAPEDFVTLHFLDSLSLAAAWKPEGGERLLDVGTGAGFPGLPLAIAFPQLDVTLLDGTRKRLNFLDGVIAELGLTNARTLHGRAEEVARLREHRGRYPLVTARAVANLSGLVGWMLPFVRSGGLAVAYKSAEVDDEIVAAQRDIHRQHARLEKSVPVSLPFTDITRKLVFIRQT